MNYLSIDRTHQLHVVSLFLINFICNQFFLRLKRFFAVEVFACWVNNRGVLAKCHEQLPRQG